MTELSHIHRLAPGNRREATPLLLLHGTGGDENDLLPLGQAIAPGATLLSVRGKVLEHGMPRFFRRLAEGVFDEDDVRLRANQLADFVREARKRYDLAAPIALGYSNGANIAAAMMLLRPEALAGGILLRAMVTLSVTPQADLAGKPVLIVSGQSDPIIPPSNSAGLATTLTNAGSTVPAQGAPGRASIVADGSHGGQNVAARCGGGCGRLTLSRHCEERSDEAIQEPQAPQELDCSSQVFLAMTLMVRSAPLRPHRPLALDRIDRHHPRTAHAQHFHFQRATDAVAVKDADQIIDAVDIDAIEPRHHIAGQQAGPRRGTVRLDLLQQRAHGIGDAGDHRMAARNRRGLAGHADMGAANIAVANDLRQHELRGIAGDRKADALGALDDRGVDADHLAVRRHQRATRIAGIERGVGLDHIFDIATVTERIERPSADTTPAVTVDSKPSGLPIATTSWPRRSVLELPSYA